MDVYVDAIQVFHCPVCAEPVDSMGLIPFTEASCPVCMSKFVVPGLFGHFLLQEKLGEGGTGPVYRAQDSRLNRTVAVKILHKVLSLNEDLVRFFQFSAQAAAALNHQNVLKVYELGKFNDQHFIAMELIEGDNLKVLMQDDEISEEEVLQIGLGIAEGLFAAQEAGLVHGDVRPKNIFIDSDGVPKIGDFGLARSISKGSSRPFSWISPYYTAPERFEGREEDVRGDIYGLGATLYHALVGRPPLDDPEPEKVIQNKRSMDVPDARLFRPDLRPETAAIIARMLERNPARRYPTYASLVSDLEEALRGFAGSSDPDGDDEQLEADRERAALAATGRVEIIEDVKPDRSAEARRIGRVGWVAAIALPVLAASGWFFFRPGTPLEPDPAQQARSTPLPPPLPPVDRDNLVLPVEPDPPPAPPDPDPVVVAVDAPPPVEPPTPPEPAWSPARIPGLVLWLRADEGVLEKDGRVIGWQDASGQGNDAMAPLPEWGPRHMQEAGQAWLRFSDSFLFTDAVVPPDAPFCLWLVYRDLDSADREGAAYKMLVGTGTPDRKRHSFAVFYDRDFSGSAGVSSRDLIRPDSLSYDTTAQRGFRVLSVQREFDGPRAQLRVTEESPQSSVLLDESWNPASIPDELGDYSLKIGALPGEDSFFQGDIAEILLFEQPPEPEDRQALADRLRQKYPSAPAP